MSGLQTIGFWIPGFTFQIWESDPIEVGGFLWESSRLTRTGLPWVGWLVCMWWLAHGSTGWVGVGWRGWSGCKWGGLVTARVRALPKPHLQEQHLPFSGPCMMAKNSERGPSPRPLLDHKLWGTGQESWAIMRHEPFSIKHQASSIEHPEFGAKARGMRDLGQGCMSKEPWAKIYAPLTKKKTIN